MVIAVAALRVLSLMDDEVVISYTVDAHVHDGVVSHRHCHRAIASCLMAIVLVLDVQVVILAVLVFLFLA